MVEIFFVNIKRVGRSPTSAFFVAHAQPIYILYQKLGVIIITKIQRLLEQLKQLSTFSYDIVLGQYQLLKNTNVSKQAFDDFEDDLKGAIAMFK